jgi:hypothetical protein
MHARSQRTLISVLSALALVGTLIVLPVAGQLTEPECDVTVDGTFTEEVADAITLTFDGDFACPDAADSGSWSITVGVTNDSEADVTIDDVTLSHASPPFAPDGNEVLTTANLPLDVGPGESGDFEAGGSFALGETGDGALVNLHLRATGTATDGEDVQPFVLGINVHVLGPGVELEDPEDGEDGADGRPEWVPGPPPWVIERLAALFGEEFPPGFWAVVNRNAESDEEGPDEGSSGQGSGSGPPSFVTLPPQAGGQGDGEDDAPSDGGPPSWVPGPPPWAGGGDGGSPGRP